MTVAPLVEICSQVLAAPFGLQKAVEHGTSPWAPTTLVGDPEEAPGSWFQPGPALTIVANRKVNQQMEDSPFPSLFLSSAKFQNI